MKDNKKFYPSTQLIMLLHPNVLKVYLYLLGWRNSDVVKIYQKQLARATKLTEEEVGIAVQTLIDNNLIQVKQEEFYEVIFNIEEALKYINIQTKDIYDMELLPVSTEVTWNKSTGSKADSIEDMSEEEIEALLLRLQARLNEKKEVKRMVKNATVKDDLPF